MSTYGCIPDHVIPPATRALVRQFVRAVSDDLGIVPPRVAWVADAGARDLPEVQRQAMGAKRWTHPGPVFAWAEGWTERTATVYLVWPSADRLTLAHELRHVAQRLRNVGPADVSDRGALERDAENYGRHVMGLPPLPRPRDRRNDPVPAGQVADLVARERALVASVHRLVEDNGLEASVREMRREYQRRRRTGTSEPCEGIRVRYKRAPSPVLTRVLGQGSGKLGPVERRDPGVRLPFEQFGRRQDSRP
jgi:hypothetical protein